MSFEKWLTAGALSILCLICAVPQVDAEPLNGLIITAGPIALTERDGVFTGSIAVTNPTSETFNVAEAPQGDSSDENKCSVSIVMGGTVPPGTASSVRVSVVPVPDTCEEPTDGSHNVVLIGSPETSPETKQIRSVPVAKPPAEPGSTGIELPETTVQLERDGDEYSGSVDITNTTMDAVTLTPSKVTGKECSLSPADPAEAPLGTPIAPGDTGKITLVVPASCQRIGSESLAVTSGDVVPGRMVLGDPSVM